MKEQYKVIRNIISEELAEFLGLYFLNLQNFSKGDLSDHQTMNTPSYDSEAITETLLVMILKRLEEEIGVRITPNVFISKSL